MSRSSTLLKSLTPKKNYGSNISYRSDDKTITTIEKSIVPSCFTFEWISSRENDGFWSFSKQEFYSAVNQSTCARFGTSFDSLTSTAATVSAPVEVSFISTKCKCSSWDSYCTPGLNLDVVNTLAHAQGLDIQLRHTHMVPVVNQLEW